MYGNYDIHPDFIKACEKFEKVTKMDMEYINQLGAEGMEIWNHNASDSKIKVTKFTTPGFDQVPLNIQVMEPAEEIKNAPCLVYYHGGGWILPFLFNHVPVMREYVLRARVKVVSVDYRIAPANPFPTPVKDCYSTLQWVHKHTDEIGVDRQRIAVGGDSAGGNLSAVMCLMAKDMGGPDICGQMLVYPATDARLSTESMKMFVDTPVWNGPLTDVAYKMYAADGDCGMRTYLSPMEAQSLQGLPSAYIEVAEFDALRDEGTNYAQGLKEAGVDVEYFMVERAPHAYDLFLKGSIIEESLQRRAAFLKRIFKNA